MVARMERWFIKERQREGIERAKINGAYAGGRHRLDSDRIKALCEAGNSVAAIATELANFRMQVYRFLREP